MAKKNVPAPTPTRSDEQILSFNAWLPDAKIRVYSYQMDKQWFTLNADILCKNLESTPVDSAHPFESPLAGEQTFFTHRANLNIPTKKSTTHVISYCQFTKLIIYYLGIKHNIHGRLVSLVHVTGDEFLLEYYRKYLEMVVRKPTAKEGGKKKTTSKADKPTKPAPAKLTKHMQKLMMIWNVDKEQDQPRKANVETEAESMVTVPIHQASLLAPPLSTPVIDLSPYKPSSPPVQEQVFTATTATTRLLPPPPPQQQSTTDLELVDRVSALEKICANFAKKNKLQDQTTQALSSRVYTLENHDLYSKIDKYVNEVVKEVVHNALQAPIRDHFRDLSKFEMKEILHDRMFESGTYRSHPEHATLYEALEASMDPWKTSDIREAPSSSSKQKPVSPPPVVDVLIPDDVHLLDSEDTDLEENKLHRKTGDMGSFIKWYCKQIEKSKLVKVDLEGPAYKVMHDINKPLPLGGPPGQMQMMRKTEVHKFSDSTLTRILEKLDVMVIDYVLFKFIPGMENRIWTEDDKRRSKEFINLIERRLKIRDLPMENPLVSVEVLRYDIKRSKSKNKGIVPTEMELVLEETQQGFSHEVSKDYKKNTAASTSGQADKKPVFVLYDTGATHSVKSSVFASCVTMTPTLLDH
nr:hypothetical protein [Tanacetum cinerariifolium]